MDNHLSADVYCIAKPHILSVKNLNKYIFASTQYWHTFVPQDP